MRVKEIEGELCVVMEDNELVLWDMGGKQCKGKRLVLLLRKRIELVSWEGGREDREMRYVGG